MAIVPVVKAVRRLAQMMGPEGLVLFAVAACSDSGGDGTVRDFGRRSKSDATMATMAMKRMDSSSSFSDKIE
jgi:hypothetical protein